jgi:hypothetical protein
MPHIVNRLDHTGLDEGRNQTSNQELCVETRDWRAKKSAIQCCVVVGGARRGLIRLFILSSFQLVSGASHFVTTFASRFWAI